MQIVRCATHVQARGKPMKTSLGPWLAVLLSLATSCGRTPLGLYGSSQPGGVGAGGATFPGEGGSSGMSVGTGGVLGAGGVVGTGGALGAGGVTGTGSETTVGQYVVSADGLTVTDTSTGLVWQRDGSGSRPNCTQSPLCTWPEAKAYCAGLTLDGSGWRLPTLDELESIVDLTVASPGPTIDQTAFPSTPTAWFWTSSPYAGPPAGAWAVAFNFGYSSSTDTDNNLRVRCVR